MTGSTTVRYPVTIEGETTMIGTANELAVALDVLQGQHDRVVLEQLRPHLAAILCGPLGVSSVLQSLAAADQLFLIDALAPRLVDLVQSAAWLRDILAQLSVVEVEEALLDALGQSGLRRLLATPRDLAEALEWVYGECDERLLALLGPEHLRHMLRDGHDLSLVLNSLGETQQSALIEQLGWERVIALVDNARDLAYLLRALPAGISKNLLRHYTSRQLAELVANRQDWEFLWRRLEPDEASYVCGILGVESYA